MSGRLTAIKGLERPVTLNFTVDLDGSKAAASGTAQFSRTDFNLGTGSDFETEDWVKFPVGVLINISATR